MHCSCCNMHLFHDMYIHAPLVEQQPLFVDSLLKDHSLLYGSKYTLEKTCHNKSKTLRH